MEIDMSIDVPLDNIRIKDFHLTGGVDFDLDEIRIKELAPINIGLAPVSIGLAPISIGITQMPDINLNAKIDPLKIDTDSKLQTDSTLKTDNKVDLDLDVSIKELPQIDLQLGLRPTRLHFPLSYQFCLTLFGIKVFEFKTCGEGMIITEDYKAKSTERCE
jgi:hypothetical protein